MKYNHNDYSTVEFISSKRLFSENCRELDNNSRIYCVNNFHKGMFLYFKTSYYKLERPSKLWKIIHSLDCNYEPGWYYEGYSDDFEYLYIFECDSKFISDFLRRAFPHFQHFTKESIRKNMGNRFPKIVELLMGNIRLKNSEYIIDSGPFVLETTNQFLLTVGVKHFLSFEEELSYVKKLCSYLFSILDEISHFDVDTSKLELKSRDNTPNYSNWIRIAALFAGKALLRTIGGDLNVDINGGGVDLDTDFDTDFDSGFDTDTSSDFTDDIGFEGGFADGDNDVDNGNNISFRGSKTIGGVTFLDNHKTITLTSAGGGKTETFDVFTKSGTNTKFIIYKGIPVKMTGAQIVIDGIRYVLK